MSEKARSSPKVDETEHRKADGQAQKPLWLTEERKKAIEEKFKELEQVKEREIVEYVPERRKRWGENINALIGQQFLIKNVIFDEGRFGRVAIFEVGRGGQRYYTSSRVLVKQAEDIQKLCNEGKIVKVTLRKVGRYLTF